MDVAPASELLVAVGRQVRTRREHLGWTRRALSGRSGVSERFLAQLEGGDGNISLLRFAAVATALGTAAGTLLTAAEQTTMHRKIALLGVRGAGKSTVGRAVAARLGMPFVEVDQRIEAAAGLTLSELFELHGEAYYRRGEHQVLGELLAEPGPMVLATGGSIVGNPTNFALLRQRCVTVWLRATAEDHWKRVIAQGDDRPMAKSPRAFDELRALLVTRDALYAEADVTIDTHKRGVEQVAASIARGVAA